MLFCKIAIDHPINVAHGQWNKKINHSLLDADGEWWMTDDEENYIISQGNDALNIPTHTRFCEQ